MNTVTLTIDNKTVTVPAGTSVLQAALDNDIFIPNLCYHPDLSPLGACGLCEVEIDGMDKPVSACRTEAKDGMIVHSDTPRTNHLRRLALELMMADHPHDCTGCPKYGSCPLQSMIQQISPSERARRVYKTYPVNEKHPLFVRDMNRCIRCGRCVRVCREVRGVNVIDYYHDQDNIVRIGSPDDLIMDSNCRSCTACVAVCPTGSLRDKEETFVTKSDNKRDMLVPCSLTCPAHTDAPRYLRYIREGRYGDAVATIREKAPFPRTLGYICTRACETACRRQFINSSVSIRDLKRFAAENDNGEWKKRGYHLPATGKKVAVVGGGPAGLTAAYYLAKKGHDVTVYEKMPEAGGTPRYGIPEYRLPRAVIQDEINTLVEEGKFHIVTNHTVNNLEELSEEGYNAVLLAIGTTEGTRLPLDGANLPGVIMNIEFLNAARLDHPMKVGKKVIVLGGGNVAFDCARVAIRNGAEEVHMCCLEARNKMTASEDEIQEGVEEGIILHPASSFVKINGTDHCTSMDFKKIKSFYFDENHKAVTEFEPNSDFEIEADNIIFSTGQHPMNSLAFGLEMTHRSYFLTHDGHATSKEGVYACGDTVTGTKSVIQAIAEGRGAASEIDAYLGGDGKIDEVLLDHDEADPHIGVYEGFSALKRQEPEALDPKTRVCSYDLVDQTLSETCAHKEADRCLQCNLRQQLKQVMFRRDM